MRSRLAAAVAVLLAVAGSAAAQSVERFQLKGAYDAIIIPKDWNGSLFLYAHGYSADKRLLKPFPENPYMADQLYVPALIGLPAGYAQAITSFRSIGWNVKDAIKDIENLRRYFVKKHGQPKHTYMWGHSGGGMITAAVIEYFPDVYDGAAPQCGPVAGARRNFDGAYDLRVAYEYLCGGVPGAQFLCRVCSDGKSRCVADADCPAGQTCGGPEDAGPPEDGLTKACTEFLLEHPERFDEATGGDFVRDPVTACFGDLTSGDGTPEQLARRDAYVRATQIPVGFIDTDLFFASIGMGEVVHRRTGGKHPWGNAGVTYASPMLTPEEQQDFNDHVHRSAADASAVDYFRRFYEPKARTKAKVVTVHALDDGLVIPENEDKYREAFAAAGRSDQLVQFFTPTGEHCLFFTAWEPGAELLTAWVERGEKPDFGQMDAACRNCLTTTTPGAWGLKVVERKQKGAPVRSLVCAANEPSDCPAGSSCSAHRMRCE